MASKDITKFVDGNGDEFNFRDPSKEAVANKVTSWSSTPSDTKYPSEKLVKTSLDAKANDTSVVHIENEESINGEKKFKGGVKISNSDGDCYGVFMLPPAGSGSNYSDWDSSLKDGEHFREWTLCFPTGANFWGRIRISFIGGYNSYNASGSISKTILCAFNTQNVYNNTGSYDALGINTENEFRISDLIWDDANARWTIKIHSIRPTSNNRVMAPRIEYYCRYDYVSVARSLTWVSTSPSIVTDTTYYTKRGGNASTSPRTGGEEFNWADKPVFQSPYGKEIFDRSHTIPVSNGGTGRTTATAAQYELLNPKCSELTAALDDNYRIMFASTDPSTSAGVFVGFRKASAFWTYIKGKISSVLGLSESNGVKTFTGNAATATTATNVSSNGAASGSTARHIWFSDSTAETKRVHDDNFTYTPSTNTVSANISGNAATATAFSSGTAKTKFDGIAEGATKVEASTTNGKVKINGTDTTVYTHPSQTAYTSKGTATKVPQITTDATGHVTGITEVTISGVTPASHTHGNIQNGGALQTNDITIASGDKLVVTDSSDSNKVARASVSFDGSTTTKALTQKGTFETFLTSHQDISGKMATDCSNKASGALQNLTSQLTEGTDAFTDGTEVFSSYASDSGFASTNHVNQPYRRKASAMWSYIKSKLGISSGKGGSDTPVYFNSDGQATTCNEMLRKNGGNATDTCMNALLMALPTNWTATPTDDTYLVRRDTGGAQSFGQVKFSTVWSYIYNKLFYVKNPADSSQNTHKRIQLGYASVGGSNVGFCCYLVHIFFNYVDGNLKGCGVTALVTFDWRASESRLAKLCIVNDNGMSAAGYNIVLANFLTDSGANLHITIGLVKKSASTTLVQFSYSYCRIVPISNGLNWTHSVASDTVGTYDFLIQGTYEDAGNAESVDGYHIQVGSYSSRTDTISLY